MKDRIQEFLSIPKVSARSKAADLKPKTKMNYALRLLQVMEKMQVAPKQFLEECNRSRKQVLTRVKTALGESQEHSVSVIHQQLLRLSTVILIQNVQLAQLSSQSPLKAANSMNSSGSNAGSIIMVSTSNQSIQPNAVAWTAQMLKRGT